MNRARRGKLHEYCVQQPPVLDQEFARRHWRQINRMVHSLIVLHETARYRKPFEPIVETARDILDARCGLLFIRNPRGARLELRVQLGLRRTIRPEQETVNQLARAALFHEKPILVNRGAGIAPEDDLLLRESTSVMAIPIRSRGIPWGVLQLGSDHTMSNEEAALLWMYALVVESALPALAALIGGTSTRTEELPEEESDGLPTVDGALLHSALAGESYSLLRLGWRTDAGAPPLRSNAEAVRLIRRSLRTSDKIMTCENGDLVISLPTMNASQSWALARSLRRSLLQSRCLGGADAVLRHLRIACVTSPIDGGGPDELLRILMSRLETAPDALRPSDSVVAWRWNVP